MTNSQLLMCAGNGVASLRKVDMTCIQNWQGLKRHWHIVSTRACWLLNGKQTSGYVVSQSARILAQNPLNLGRLSMNFKIHKNFFHCTDWTLY